MAEGIGLNATAEPLEKVDTSTWTPDQQPPAMRKVSTDDLPDFETFNMQFGAPSRWAGGKGIVMDAAQREVVKPTPNGTHKDGSPRDVMEDPADCRPGGMCTVCR